MAMTTSRKILLGMTGVVVLVVAGSTFGSLPSASDISGSASGDRTAALTFSQQASAAEAAVNDSAAFGSNLAKARTAVPPTPDLGLVITQLEQLTTAAGMSWMSGSLARGVGGQDGTWGLDMKVSGSPERLLALLDSIQSMPRLMTIDTMNMQAPDGIDATTALSLRFYSTVGDLDAFPQDERDRIEAALETLPSDEATQETQ